MSNSITRERLKEIVSEELEKLVVEGVINELAAAPSPVDHSSIAEIVKSASGFMKALEKFQEKATPTMQHSLHPLLSKLETALTDMITTPSSYVAVMKKPRKVSLRNVNGEKKVK